LIIFKYARWKNFLSTGNQFIEIQLDKSPTTLIVGENGAGKSTILDVLCFGLFGKPFRGINKAQLVNSINNSSTIIEIEFTIGTRNYKVVRGIKPNKFEIYQNDKMMNLEANVRDYQKILEQQILKLNYRSFTQVVILGSSTFVPFMQLKARHRREVVEEILDIQIFSIMNLLARQKTKELTEEIREVDYNYDITTEKIELQENYIEDIKKNKDDIIVEKTNLLTSNEEEISDRKTEQKNLTETNEKLLSSIIDEDKAISKRDKLKDFRFSLKDKHSRESALITFFEENDECPTCEQHIDEEFKKEKIKQNQTSVKELDDGLNKLSDEMKKIEAVIKEHKNTAKSIRENDIALAKITSGITQLEKFNTKLKIEIDSLSKGSISDADTEKLKNLKDTFAKIDEQRKHLKEEKSYIDAIRLILQDTGIKTKIIKQYLPVMNNLINKYLTSMEFYVNFTLNENFEETIKSRFRDEFTYSSFSEGEKMRIDLALLFTWRAIAKMKNSANTNLLILDEIFDSSLDGTGTDEFLKILNTLGGENVFVISHKQDTLADKFRETIRFEKVKNFSHVVT
tara:strand:- start:8 stop:1717 length:1710 start_codon:yes stop_codon:yes gene_type:complete